MDTIDRGTILGLAQHGLWPSASILMPVDHVGIHADADRVRLRGLVKSARDLLVLPVAAGGASGVGRRCSWRGRAASPIPR